MMIQIVSHDFATFGSGILLIYPKAGITEGFDFISYCIYFGTLEEEEE
jgi:hypothetical protein